MKVETEYGERQKNGLEYVKGLGKGFWIMNMSKRIPTEYSTFNMSASATSSVGS